MNNKWFEIRLDEGAYTRRRPPNEESRFMGVEYRFVPPAERIEDAPLQPANGRKQNGGFLSHRHPVIGGFSGRISVELKAETPVLFGQAVQCAGEDVVMPARVGDRYVIPGRASRGMIKAIYRIATCSALAPVNEHHRFGNRTPEYLKFAQFMDDGHSLKEEPKRGWLIPNVTSDGKLALSGWKIYPEQTSPEKTPSITGLSIKQHLQPQFKKAFPDREVKDRSTGKPYIKKYFWSSAPLKKRRDALVHHYDALKVHLREGEHLIVTGPINSKKSESVFGSPNTSKPLALESEENVLHFLQTFCSYAKLGPEFPDGVRRMPNEALSFFLADYHKQFKSKGSTEAARRLISAFGLREDKLTPSPYPSGLPGIPVYYYESDQTNGRGVIFGLSGLFKVPFRHSVGDLLKRRPRRESTGLDWTDALFGTIGEEDAEGDDNTQPAIAGRVSFSFAPAQGNTARLEDQSHIVVQGAPKASYDPFYVAEPPEGLDEETWKGSSKGTWDSETAILAGHKRYPVARKFNGYHEFAVANASKTTATVRPLNAGAVFRLAIDFDNLHPLELGALLWSISFGDRTVFEPGGETDFRHVGGRLRGKGLGRLVPKNASLDLRQNPMPEKLQLPAEMTDRARADALMLAFETHMGHRVAGEHTEDDQSAFDAFYEHPSIRALRNLSDSKWQPKSETQAAMMFVLPMSGNKPNFKTFSSLRNRLYKKITPYDRPVATILDEFMDTTGSPKSTTDRSGDWFDALRRPAETLMRYRKTSSP